MSGGTFVEVPSAVLVATLDEIGTKVLHKEDGGFTWHLVGRERVFDLFLPERRGLHLTIRVFTSIANNSRVALRGRGKDAIRVILGHNPDWPSGDTFKPLGKSKRVFRTAPRRGTGSEEERVGLFIDRFRQVLRDAYRTANRVRPCPECKSPMTSRKGRKGEFMGCTNYPTCTHTENL